MKQPFVNATLNDRRKGRETLAQTAQSHPARPSAVLSPESPLHLGRIPLITVPKLVAPPLSDLDKMKNELLMAMRALDKKPKSVPKSKLIGLGMGSSSEEPVRDYNDILAMLLSKK